MSRWPTRVDTQNALPALEIPWFRPRWPTTCGKGAQSLHETFTRPRLTFLRLRLFCVLFCCFRHRAARGMAQTTPSTVLSAQVHIEVERVVHVAREVERGVIVDRAGRRGVARLKSSSKQPCSIVPLQLRNPKGARFCPCIGSAAASYYWRLQSRHGGRGFGSLGNFC